MFYAGWLGWVHWISAYSLSCRARFPNTCIILNMLLIMFCFLWKNHFSSIMYMSRFLCIIWHWHMLRYVGIHWAIGVSRAPKQGCFRPTSSPPPGTCMFHFFENIIFHPCSIYVYDSFYYLNLTYVILCRLLVRHRCFKSTRSMTHLWQASMYVYVSLSFNCDFNDSMFTFLIFWNCLIVSLSFCT